MVAFSCLTVNRSPLDPQVRVNFKSCLDFSFDPATQHYISATVTTRPILDDLVSILMLPASWTHSNRGGIVLEAENRKTSGQCLFDVRA